MRKAVQYPKPPTIMRRPTNAVPELTPEDIGYHAPPEGIIQTVGEIASHRKVLIENAAREVFRQLEGWIFLKGDSVPFEKIPELDQQRCRNIVAGVVKELQW